MCKLQCVMCFLCITWCRSYSANELHVKTSVSIHIGYGMLMLPMTQSSDSLSDDYSKATKWHKLTETRPWPLNEDWSSLVNLESLYGICVDLPSVNFDMTCIYHRQKEIRQTHTNPKFTHTRECRTPDKIFKSFSTFSEISKWWKLEAIDGITTRLLHSSSHVTKNGNSTYTTSTNQKEARNTTWSSKHLSLNAPFTTYKKIRIISPHRQYTIRNAHLHIKEAQNVASITPPAPHDGRSKKERTPRLWKT